MKKRSDRVIATEWDITFALTAGVPDAATIRRLQANVPLQEEGRVSEQEWGFVAGEPLGASV